MKMKHLLLEGYCSCDIPNQNNPCYMTSKGYRYTLFRV